MLKLPIFFLFFFNVRLPNWAQDEGVGFHVGLHLRKYASKYVI